MPVTRGAAAGTRLCTLFGAGVFALFMVSAFTPLPNLLSARLAVPPRMERADAIVVLGGGGVSSDGMPTDASLRRAIRGVVLHRMGLAPLLVFTGLGPEAAARVELARDLGVPPERVLADDRLHTTREEAIGLQALLRPRGVRKILLVTDSQHMIRAQRLLERARFEVFAVPADDVSTTATGPSERLDLARGIVGELLARLYYRAAGYL